MAAPPAILYGSAVFLGSFLLFQVQPLAAKAILPWFGGASAVWNTCMLFFQGALLGGYAYAHWAQRWSGRRLAYLHASLLAVSLFLLPPLPAASWKYSGIEHPLRVIPLLLGASLGLPYLLLCSTSPLLQSWFARTHPGRSPYWLFARSNLASLLALVSYPLLVEPHLSVRAQGVVWSLAYGVFALLCGVLAWRAAAYTAQPRAGGCAARTGWMDRALWLLLPAVASVLLLATTTFLTQDVAAIPFLWVLPLCIYLLSFILSFESPRFYDRRVYMVLLPAALGAAAWMLWPNIGLPGVVATVALASAALFVFCMVCHGELARLKPEPGALTAFYLTLAAGGAAGGLFVALAAPTMFRAYHEFPIGLGACAVLAAVVLGRSGMARRWQAGLAVLCLGYVALLGYSAREGTRDYRFAERNFYGQVRVVDRDEEDDMGMRRNLVHGRINHGQQLLSPWYRRTPVTYFCPETGIGRAMEFTAAASPAPRRIGILGLGAGVLAAYGRPGDVIRIYEINPLVLKVANSEFSYLRDSPAHIEQVLGDGRLALEREVPQNFDVLVMDAFAGDSVPTHLVTREAIAVYLRHLKPGGILAVNISNKYIDLRPVMERAARQFGRVPLCYDFEPGEEDLLCYWATWVLLVEPSSKLAAGGPRIQPFPRFRMWTDDYSNLFSVLQ